MEENNSEILISIIIIATKNHYLTPLTLERILNQTDKRYEIIVITQNILPKDLVNIKRFSNHFKLIKAKPGLKDSQIKNVALKKAKGMYVHFLYPGEYYLSKYSLSYALNKASKKKFPNLVCFSFLRRELYSPPEIRHASFSKSVLGSEGFPVLAKDVFFLKQSIVDVGGFDTRFSGLEGFDMITKIYLKEKSRILCCRRVVIDYELQKYHPKKLMAFISDLILIIYRRYGFFSLFRWAILKEIIDLFVYWLIGIKRYFIKSE